MKIYTQGFGKYKEDIKYHTITDIQARMHKQHSLKLTLYAIFEMADRTLILTLRFISSDSNQGMPIYSSRSSKYVAYKISLRF